MSVMQPPADPARDESPGNEKAPARPAAFIPLAFADGLGWIPVSVPQAAARAACLNATAHIHLFNPGLPLRDLDARAEEAISALENGAVSVTINESHRVDRVGTAPGRRASP
jgi:hypothetical protein